MFLETVRAEGLSHLSYVIGDAGKAVVIDPRRDCRIYVDTAARYGAQITHIFETHRHEDFVSGSLELARRTKAKILHGGALTFKFGDNAKEGNTFDLGNVRLKILETPGHTPESLCIALIDRAYSDEPVAVFTGDTLFAGGVGRTDLYPALRDELSGQLYDSLHKKLLPLGDHVLIYPAHGEGSICGVRLAAREVSSIGYERRTNSLLTKSRKDFIQHKIGEELYTPPYFRQMEKFNQDGIPLVAKLPEPKPADAKDFENDALRSGLLVLDVRGPEAFAGAHIPGALSIPFDRLTLLAGWFLPYDRRIGLVMDRDDDADAARLHLMRMGFDNVALYLAGGMRAWIRAGKPIENLPVVSIEGLRRRVAEKEKLLVLDVRDRTEYLESPSDPSRHIWIGDLPQKTEALPREGKIVALCTNGECAATAASLLKQERFTNVEICMGAAKVYKAARRADKAEKRAA